MELDKMMKALGEPTRLQIFRFLLERKHCIRSLSEKLGITESAVSQHMKVLREAGLVYGRRCGYHIHYYPDPDTVSFLAEAVDSMRIQAGRTDRDVCACGLRRGDSGHTC